MEPVSLMVVWGFGDGEDEPEFRYQEYSIFCLHFDNCFRQLFINLIESPYFDAVSMICILMNCVTLSLFDPFDSDCLTEKCKTLAWFEFAFNLFFTLECVCKVDLNPVTLPFNPISLT